ncbi:hypothetical protein [Ferrovibrio terrae]|uniref:hypothetical protein n=1 Tax=Ferrovibrio terrae TaxID=2594003 RepID=UPI0031380C78
MFIEYIVFTGMLLVYAGTGYMLGARSLLTAILLGLGSAGIAANILAVSGPALIKPALFGLAALGGLGLYLTRHINILSVDKSRLLKTGILTDALLLLLVAWIFRFLEAHLYIFEPHDVLYFSPALEMLKADYFDSLRLFTYYPEKMASFHHFSSGILAALLAPVKTPTMIDAVNARYVIIVVCMFLFLRPLLRRHAILSLLIFLALLTIYGEEINYSLTISSYFYVLLLFGISAILIRRKEPPQVFVLLLFVLTCAKGPIFYSAFLAALFAGAVFWRQINKPIFGLYLILVLTAVACWIVPPPPYDGQELGLTIYRGIPAAAAQEAMSAVTGWTLRDPVVRQITAWFGADSLLTALSLLLINTVKYYLAGFMAVYALGRRFSGPHDARPVLDQHKMGMVLAAYIVLSLAGFLWIRNGLTAAHQAHGPLLAAALSAAVLSVWASERQSIVRPLLICAGLLVLYAPHPNEFSLPNYHVRQGRLTESDTGKSTWKFGEPLPAPSKDGWYKAAQGETMIMSEILAGLTGQRLRITDAPSAPEGVIRYWRTGK